MLVCLTAVALQVSGASFCAFSVLNLENAAPSHTKTPFASCVYVGVCENRFSSIRPSIKINLHTHQWYFKTMLHLAEHVG